MRRAVTAVAALVLGAAATSITPAEGAEKGPSAAELGKVQAKANRAAANLGRAESALARAQDGIVELESRAEQTKARLSSLENQVRQMAVRQYLRSGAPESWMGEADFTNRVRGQALLRSVTQQQADAIDGYRATRAELGETREALGEQLDARRKAVGELRKERTRISAELSRLAAAQKAYEARVAAEKAAAARAAAARARPTRSSGSAAVNKSVAEVSRVLGSGDWICPVQGARAFSNDWGQPRSGGRRHQGNDIFASRGTPVVASVAGTVRGHNSSRGGISYYLSGADGNTYFGTHLDRLSGASGRVGAGTVVGYVGSSGNASASSPHLHFEIHPGGGGPVNPFPTVARYC
ncbi:MAG TPA: peptidoglycan DD-metalloendopeptidase family protein [Acidimicrobiales bacterium]|nr:peptidoglycan DD-metalloendopeptidase family protein [Acidimicrobiales bacterium]